MRGGYHFATPEKYAPKFELPGLWFNASEIHALLMMQSLLEGVQPGLLGPHIAPLQTRLQSLLGSQDDAPTEIARRIRIVHAAKRNGDLKYFDLIASTLLKRRRLLVRHWHRATDRETEREVSPQRLIYYRDNWYLDSWCHLRNEVRSFAVDAIRHATLIDRRAKEVAKRELDGMLRAGYGIFSGAKVEWARLKFSPARARWVSAEQWHPDQKASFDQDGNYLLQVPYANPTELVMDILRHGASVEVMAPAALKNAVRAELDAARDRYA
jgi:predicted DNA-binding transcriptional regulator YafY